MKHLYRIIICFLCAAIAFAYINENAPKLAKKYYQNTFKPSSNGNGEAFEENIYNGVLIKLEQNVVSDNAIIYRKKLTSKLFAKKKSVFEFGEYGLLLHYTYQYAINHDDSILVEKIKIKFDNRFRENSQIKRNDQTTYGNVAIDLYLYTGDEFYKEFANRIYLQLDSLDKKDGIITYRPNEDTQNVDVLGFVCPFLRYYSDVFHNERAYEIAHKICIDYIEWGTDPITGIPVQAYNIENHLKLKRCNWGRGVSWFLLGISSLRNEELSYEYRNRINLLCNTLLSNQDLLYTQYLGEGHIPDMSATIPILWYLCTNKHVTLTKDEIIQIISPYFDCDGVMRWCSPSIGMPQESSNAWQSNMAFQGLALHFISAIP